VACYVYRCPNCNKVAEIYRPISEYNAPPPKCHECQVEMVRVFSPPFIQFVGPGFHVNDYPSKSGGRDGD